MTKEEILAMEAGEELSQKVAEEIMGECYHQHWDGDRDSIDCLKCGESRFYHQRSQAYSTDISAAWPVVERMQEDKEAFYYLELRYSRILHCWMAVFEHGNDQHEEIEGKTAPEAICKAALLAKVKQ